VTVPLIDDDKLPAVAVLLGAEAAEVLAAAVAQGGGALRSLRLEQVNYQPGRRLVVEYAARVQLRHGRYRDESLVAVADVAGPPPGSLVLEAQGIQVGAWRVPHDPFLPGLPRASSPAGVRALLGRPPGAVSVSRRAYRPCRRAVLLATAGRLQRYVKVVLPRRATQLRGVHERLAGAVPVPRVVGGSDSDGVLLLEALPGRVLSVALVDGEDVPDPGRLVAVLDRLANVPLSGERRPTSTENAPMSAATLSAVLRSEHERVARLLTGLGEDRREPLVTCHGDFYEAQLLLADGEISGVLDVDGAGPGERVEDLANLLGHLSALTLWRPAARLRVEAYGTELLEAFETLVDPVELRRRAAAVLFGLATGPFRMQQPNWETETRKYLDLVEAWLASAKSA